jgi:hypothetical protein
VALTICRRHNSQDEVLMFMVKSLFNPIIFEVNIQVTSSTVEAICTQLRHPIREHTKSRPSCRTVPSCAISGSSTSAGQRGLSRHQDCGAEQRHSGSMSDQGAPSSAIQAVSGRCAPNRHQDCARSRMSDCTELHQPGNAISRSGPGQRASNRHQVRLLVRQIVTKTAPNRHQCCADSPPRLRRPLPLNLESSPCRTVPSCAFQAAPSQGRCRVEAMSDCVSKTMSMLCSIISTVYNQITTKPIPIYFKFELLLLKLIDYNATIVTMFQKTKYHVFRIDETAN